MSGTGAPDTGASLGDIDGILVGHHQRLGAGWATGTTVIVCPAGATGGVDVRGGAPGTRETDLLRPENLVERVHAVCLSGGSAYGLAAADGVMRWLARRRIGLPVGLRPGEVVPIVPAAVIFDLGRGGRFSHRPSAAFGSSAAAAASRGTPPIGTVGAGTGAVAGGLKGGVGSAGRVLPDGTIVAALAVVNALGTVIDRGSGLPHVPVPGIRLRRPCASDRATLRSVLDSTTAPMNTTIGVVATSATLSKAECTKFAAVAQDGIARAVRPAHSPFDGDTIFALAAGRDEVAAAPADIPFAGPGERPGWLARLFEAGAESFAEACTAAVVGAASIDGIPAYRELCPSAFG